MEIKLIYQRYIKSYRVVKDSREDVQDAIYFSLKGDNFDGNCYAQQALDQGANFAIIDNEAFHTDERMILVNDSLSCLQELARYHRQQLGIPILALTGSNGKTTTKELIHSVLSQKFKCTSTRGNLNNHIGVPLTLLSLTPKDNFGVIEMGANHIGEIRDLCAIAEPDFGLITNFGRVHLEGFGSFEGVIKGKTEMYDFLREKKAKVFVNSGDELQMEKSKGMDRISYGTEESMFPMHFIKADPFVKMSFKGQQVNSSLIGAYNYDNIAVAAAIGSYFNIDAQLIGEAIESYVPSNNRSQMINKGSNKIILDAYNANPNSMEAAILNLSRLSAPAKVAVLGDMFELGDDSKVEHQKVEGLLREHNIDRAYLIGTNFSGIICHQNSYKTFKTFEEFKHFFCQQDIKNTTFLIKASRGMQLERVVDLI